MSCLHSESGESLFVFLLVRCDATEPLPARPGADRTALYKSWERAEGGAVVVRQSDSQHRSDGTSRLQTSQTEVSSHGQPTCGLLPSLPHATIPNEPN